MEQNRLKSPVVRTSIAAQVLSLLVLLGVVDTGLSNALNSVVAAALQHNMATVPRCQATFDLHGQILAAIEHRDAEQAKRLSRTLIES